MAISCLPAGAAVTETPLCSLEKGIVGTGWLQGSRGSFPSWTPEGACCYLHCPPAGGTCGASGLRGPGRTWDRDSLSFWSAELQGSSVAPWRKEREQGTAPDFHPFSKLSVPLSCSWSPSSLRSYTLFNWFLLASVTHNFRQIEITKEGFMEGEPEKGGVVCAGCPVLLAIVALEVFSTCTGLYSYVSDGYLTYTAMTKFSVSFSGNSRFVTSLLEGEICRYSKF